MLGDESTRLQTRVHSQKRGCTEARVYCYRREYTGTSVHGYRREYRDIDASQKRECTARGKSIRLETIIHGNR